MFRLPTLTTLPLTLASASPRRVILLEQIGIKPQHIIAPEIDEIPLKDELPRSYVKRMAQYKMQRGQKNVETRFILTADTIVAAGRRILNKTSDCSIAETHLRLLSGRRHRVYTYVILANVRTGRVSSKLVSTIVQLSRFTETQLQTYLKSNEWIGTAGAYAIQGRASSFVKKINGSYSNIVGLPLFETAQLLRGQGLLP
ncbi:dTTP/UTP pyrophosphatase [Commensalibacter sp. Nvir]|uniref:Maf family protein n=1 Tax=Commensalibacter sp. Nvir TaxID=3069817 RepID=UPI002D42B438|nr:dTTP/UTP pyrophosphatase [Commensalibacter sp. Nvir]